MPSTIGHALAGATIAWALPPSLRASLGELPPSLGGSLGELRRDRLQRWLVPACVVIAAAPDADLAFGVHRTFTHSITATAVVALVATLVAMWRRAPIARIVIACTAAHASHLLLDWLAADNYPPYGMQLLWPFSDRWFISGLDLFLGTRREQFFSAAAIQVNARAVAREILILGPIAYVAWLVARTRGSGHDGGGARARARAATTERPAGNLDRSRR